MQYKVPQRHYFRLHHVRPRFKNDMESVLLFVCQRIANIGEKEKTVFDEELYKMMRLYPGNLHKKPKTIRNWCTEISSLFGLIEQNSNASKPGLYADLLAKNEDLIEFFRYFLLTFQYPGGHIKPHRVKEQIERGVYFHPAKFIIDLFLEGQKLLPDDKFFHVSSPEITALVFNDLRVTATMERTPATIASILHHNRASKTVYQADGDVVRYAQDILDYMVWADVLSKRPANNFYYLKPRGLEAALRISCDAPRFYGYREFYGLENLKTSSIREKEGEWLRFVNSNRISRDFVGDVLSILESDTDDTFNAQLENLDASLQVALEGDAQDIGRVGESIVIQHEKVRLKSVGKIGLAEKVKKLPDHLAVGYDVLSYEGNAPIEMDDYQRFIEVKTTRSKRPLSIESFTMTTNEWQAAKSNRENYYVYRLIISEGSLKMFVIRDPYGEESRNNLEMTPRNGAEITYTEAAGTWVPVLLKEHAKSK